jgi:hypothetical protein
MKWRPIAVALAVGALAPGALAARAAAPHWKVWLCFPGREDPCQLPPTATVFSQTGAKTVVPLSATRKPAIDCFYLYPTVSNQHRPNSTLDIQWPEIGTAIGQAGQFSRICKVYAPMYHQVTTFGNDDPFHGSYKLEYSDILAAWKDYLAHYNHGRGVVLIGHSEGSFLFKQLIAEQIEGKPVQKQLVSAILLGGNVQVKNGSTRGGDFKSVPACTSGSETGCVVAYSSWSHTPPNGASFQQAGAGEHVLCVNPAAPGSTAAVPITPLFPNFAPEGLTPLPKAVKSVIWEEFPNLYTARCAKQGSHAWLLISRVHHTGDPRPTVKQVLNPNWGLHAADVNVALVNLIALVSSQGRAWVAHR